MLYQSAHKYDLKSIFGIDEITPDNTIIIMDEIHDMLSPIYFNFAKNNLIGNDIPRIGLSATIDTKTKYENDGEEINKIDMLNQFCPVVFTYTVTEGQNDNTSRKVNLFVVYNELDNYNRNILTGTKTQKWSTTELAQYQYYDKEFRKSLFLPTSNKSREFLIRAAASRRQNHINNEKTNKNHKPLPI